jgi:hypothetical protein
LMRFHTVESTMPPWLPLELSETVDVPPADIDANPFVETPIPMVCEDWVELGGRRT